MYWYIIWCKMELKLFLHFQTYIARLEYLNTYYCVILQWYKNINLVCQCSIEAWLCLPFGSHEGVGSRLPFALHASSLLTSLLVDSWILKPVLQATLIWLPNVVLLTPLWLMLLLIGMVREHTEMYKTFTLYGLFIECWNLYIYKFIHSSNL